MALKNKSKNENGEVQNISPEVGHILDNTDYDQIYSEAKRDLMFPASISTFDKMAHNIVVGTALNVSNIIASRTPIYFIPYDDKKVNKERCEFLEQCFTDMTHTMKDFILDCMTSHKYGFAIIEKVFRYRNRSEGSKFDDGLVGLKRLPLRPQSTITGWDFDDDMRELLGMYQKNVSTYISNSSDLSKLKITQLSKSISSMNTEDIFIARDRFLHIKADGVAGNPEGKSPLSVCYNTWKKLEILLDTEEIACYKNLNGIAVAKIPAIYMSNDATEEQKMVAKIHRDGVTKLGRGEQSGIVLPSDRDDNGAPYFDFKLESASSSNITAISSVIKTRYEQIYQALFADIMIISTGTSGAVKNKADMLNLLVESRLNEVCEQINSDLIPDLFRRNGWDDTKTPKVQLGKLSDIDMAVYAKALQQLKATNLVPITPENLNFISSVFDLPFRFDPDATDEEINAILRVDSEQQSRSGDGYSKGTGNGTSDKVSVDDNSASNLGNS